MDNTKILDDTYYALFVHIIQRIKMVTIRLYVHHIFNYALQLV